MADRKKATKTAAAKRTAAKKAPQVNRTENPPEAPKDAPEPSQEQEDVKRDDVAEDTSPVDYKPVRQPLEHEGFDHHAAEEKRQAELAAQRDEHNQRVSRGFKF